MGLEEKLPSGILLTTVEKVAGYARKSSVWPATFGLACCAIELMQTGGPRHDLARFGMERASNTPRQADLMIVAGRVSQKMAPVLRQIYDQMADPKWVISMGVCASSGGMFNNYAIVQGVDHVVPVDIYLPGCPPRPEMLLDAIVKLHDKIMNMKLGVNREREVTEQVPEAQLAMVGSMASDDPEGREYFQKTYEYADNDLDIKILSNLNNVGAIEVNAFQSQSDVCLQKSIREGFGLTVTEALWKGKPTIAGAVGGIPNQIIHKLTGMLVHSVEGCAYQIRYLLTHPEFAAQMGKNGREHVKENFLMTTNVRRWLLLLRILLTQGKA